MKFFIAWLAPFFILFEVVQLFVAHRYIGPDQIRTKVHPLDLPAVPPLWLSASWMVCLWADYVYQLTLFFVPTIVRLAALSMIGLSIFGFLARRVCGLKWGMVIMTFEGAGRAGFLVFAFRMMVFPPSWASHLSIFGLYF